MKNRLAVCSWSLAPRSPRELAERVRACGLDAVQLALDPLRTEATGAWSLAETRAVLDEAGVAILSGMMATKGEDYSTLDSIRRTGGVRPDEHWEENLAAAAADARLARTLGLELVTFHAGFLPEDRGSSERAILIDRLREIADVYADEGVHVAFETGQETAETLASVLAELERPGVGVNFDPANLLLYGMGEPIAALRQLAPHVRQIHVKDGRRPRVPGAWGEELPVGEGEVDWHAFFRIVADFPIEGDLVIERESGSSRTADIRRAHDVVRRELPHGTG